MKIANNKPAMNVELTDVDKIRSIPWKLTFSVFNTIFCYATFAGSILVLFFSELGLEKSRIGFIQSFVPFCGMVAPFIAAIIARIGFKRIFLIFWSIRSVVISLMIFTPWILDSYGQNAAFGWVAVILFCFAFCRAIGVTAEYPWYQEIIPDSIRGKYIAMANTLMMLASIITIAVIGYIIDHYQGLHRFTCIFAGGILASIIAVACSFKVAGGKAIHNQRARSAKLEILLALYDKTFVRYMLGLAVVSLVMLSFASFVPLFMKEQVGLESGKVIWLEIGSCTGGLISCFFWGWASDRYGSRPVMLTGLCIMTCLPFLWFLMPRGSPFSLPSAMTMASIAGMSGMGFGIGASRYLYVTAVPQRRKTAYMAVFYAVTSAVGGIGPLLSGLLLEKTAFIDTKILHFSIDAYTPFFGINLVLLILAYILLSGVRSDGAVSTRKFVSMFMRGNPLLAFESIVMHRFGRTESRRLLTTQRMGRTKNPLLTNELIEALNDPSFHVRYEAIIAASQMPTNPRLIDKLLQILTGQEPELSNAAAWAIGHFGDRRTVIALRETLLSEYPLLKASSARALGRLGDYESIPVLLECFRNEPDEAVRIAYASALGALGSKESAIEIFTFLSDTQDQAFRAELTLSLARITGGESDFIKCWRDFHANTSTAVAQNLLALKRQIANVCQVNQKLKDLFDNCIDSFARGEVSAGTEILVDIINQLPRKLFTEHLSNILAECANRLAEFGPDRIEFVVLSVHILNLVISNRS